MGWWNANDGEDIVVGDAVLDLVRRFLREFSQEYQEDLGRKPTAAELEYVLDLAFKANVDDDILAGFEEREVKQVSLKLKKAAKRQKAKPGDIFAFKLDDGRFAFGRIVALVSVGAVAELFDYIADQPIFDYTKLGTWLVRPLTISTYCLFERRMEGDWRIIGHTPDYKPGPEFDDIRFVYGTPPHALTAVGIADRDEQVSVEAAKGMRSYACLGDTNVKMILEKEVGIPRSHTD